MLMKQLSIFLENTPGRLAFVTGVLAAHDIDIRALSIADTRDYGVLRLIVDAPDAAAQALRAESVTVSLTDVIAVEVPDVPGGLARVIDVLYRSDVAIEYMYAFVNPKDGMACVIFRVEDNQKASEVLADKGIRLMTEHDIIK